MEFPVGETVYIPASSAPIITGVIPSEFDLGNGKPVWIPAVVKSYDGDKGCYLIDWGHSEVKSPANLTLPRSPNDDSSTFDELSKLTIVNEATILFLLWKRFRMDQFTSRVANLLIVINPVSGLKRKGLVYSNNIPLLRSISTMDPLQWGQFPSVLATTALIRNKLLSNPKTQTLGFFGCSGSGKTELLKSVVQYLVYDSSVIRNSVNAHPPLDEYEPLGTLKNPFILPSDVRPARALYASLMVLDFFGSAPTAGNRTSSRHLKIIKLLYGNQGKELRGGIVNFLPLEVYRCSPKDNFQRPYFIYSLLMAGLPPEVLEGSKISPSLRDGCLKAPDNDVAYLSAQFAHFRETLFSLGLSPSCWDGIVQVLLACAHIQSTQIMGGETANLATASKNNLSNAEDVLGAPSGALTDCIMRFYPEQKVGKPIPSPAKTSDAKSSLEAISNELYQRVFRYLISFCNKMSLVDSPEQEAAFSPDDPCLQLFDYPGWELFESVTNGIVQMNINFIEERMSNWFSRSLVAKYSEPYEQECVSLPPVEFPNNTTFLDFVDDPTTGTVALLQESCLNALSNQKGGEDKVFAEKLLSTHTKTKLVRLASTKTTSKSNQFIVKHSFAEVAYDCEGFFSTNKSRLSLQSQTFIDELSQECLSSQAGGKDPFPIRIFGTEPVVEDISTEKKSKAFGVDKLKVASAFYLNRTRDALWKTLSSLEETDFSHVVCLRPSSDLQSQTLNPELLAPQIRQYGLGPFTTLVKSSFSFSKKYSEFYEFFRPMLAFQDPRFPLHLSDIPEATLPDLCKGLMAASLKVLCFPETVNSLTPSSVTFGKSMIFMRDEIASRMVDGRNLILQRILKATSLLQASYRMSRQRRRFLREKKCFFRILFKIKGFIYRLRFKKMRMASNLIKGKLLMKREMDKFKKMKWAVGVIKRCFFGKMIQRIRYKRMQRALLLFQSLVRGFIIRREGCYIYRSVVKIQRCARRFSQALYTIRLERSSAITIQKVFRGWIYRERNTSLVRVFNIRRKQRIANNVTRKLQASFRMKRVRDRFLHLVWATRTLQGWFRERIDRMKFLKIKYLALWLQKNARMIRDANLANQMKVVSMVEEEGAVIAELNRLELDRVRNVSSSDLILASGFIKNDHIRFVRRILTLDMTFDLTEAYPGGWLNTMISFGEKMRQGRRRINLVEVGCEHTILVDDLSNVYTFGAGDSGQLGHNNRKNQPFPRLMESLQQAVAAENLGFTRSASIKEPMKVVNVCCGRQHSLLLLATGRIYSWGSNLRGQLGHSNFESSAVPRLVGNNSPNGILKNVSQIACGSYHSACIMDPGYLYVWGAGDCIGNHVSKRLMYSSTRIKQQLQQTQRLSSTSQFQTPTSVSSSSSQLLQQQQQQPSEGSGPGSDDCCEPNTLLFFHKRRVQTLLCGDVHIAVRCGNSYYSWGKNPQGQLGIGSCGETHWEPQMIDLPEMSEQECSVSSLYCGGKHMALLLNGSLWVWGSNKYGQVGVGHVRDVLTPTKVLTATLDTPAKSPNGRKLSSKPDQVRGSVCSVALGSRNSMAMSDTGQIFAWGVLSFCRPESYLMGGNMRRRSSTGRNSNSNGRGRGSMTGKGEGSTSGSGSGVSGPVITASARRRSVLGTVGMKIPHLEGGRLNPSLPSMESTDNAQKYPSDPEQLKLLEQSFQKYGSTFQISATPSLVRLPLEVYAPINNLQALGRCSSSLSLIAIDTEDLDGRRTTGRATQAIQSTSPSSSSSTSPLKTMGKDRNSPTEEFKSTSPPLLSQSSSPSPSPAETVGPNQTSTLNKDPLSSTFRSFLSRGEPSSWDKTCWKSQKNLPNPDEVKARLKQTLGTGISLSSLHKKKGPAGDPSKVDPQKQSLNNQQQPPFPPESTSKSSSSSLSSSTPSAERLERKNTIEFQRKRTFQAKQERLFREGTLRPDSVTRLLCPESLSDQESPSSSSSSYDAHLSFHLRREDLTNGDASSSSSSNPQQNLLSVALSKSTVDDFDRRMGSRRGVGMPKGERNLLSKFADEWRQTQVNRLDQFVEGEPLSVTRAKVEFNPDSPLKKQAIRGPSTSQGDGKPRPDPQAMSRKASGGESTSSTSDPYQREQKSGGAATGIGSNYPSSSSSSITPIRNRRNTDNALQDFNSAIESLRRDIRRMEEGEGGWAGAGGVGGGGGGGGGPGGQFSSRSSVISNRSRNKSIVSQGSFSAAERRGTIAAADMRDMTALIQNIKKESLQQMAESWRY